MEIRARYYGKLKDGSTVYVCGHHVDKIARRGETVGRLMPRRGVRFIGSLQQYTSKVCCECHGGTGHGSLK